MRVLLISPSVPPDPSGNAATAGRLAASLGRLGIEVTLSRGWEGGCFDLVHVPHLVKAGRCLPAGGEHPPVVASAGGTDLMRLSSSEAAVRDSVLALARRVLVPTGEACQTLTATHPEWKAKCRLVPRGVALEGSTPFDLRAAAGAAAGQVLFFLPAGFRAVKRNALPAAALEGLGVRLAAAGPVLEAAEAEAFDLASAGKGWIRRLLPVPPRAMGAALAGADVVLNTSSHEGMSNALLEAMLAGRAVLASDIPGNRAAIRDGMTGLLFVDAKDLREKARALALDPGVRERLGRAAREEARARFSPATEARSVLEAYREARIQG